MRNSTTISILAVAVFFAVNIVLSWPSMGCECIVSGETKSASIQFGGETHCYWFWAEAGHGVVIEMGDMSSAPGIINVLEGLEPRVQLYDPNGVRIGDAGSDGSCYSRVRIEVYKLKMTGIYTIVASDADGYYSGYQEYTPDTGDYGLSLVVTGGTTTSLQDRDGGDMTIGHAQKGTITPGGDTDSYVFYGQVDQGVTIEMTDMSSAHGIVSPLDGLEPRVQLYDPNGVRVADSGSDGKCYARATIENYQLKMTGIYTVVASDADGYYSGYQEYTPDTGEYGLSVSVMPPKNPYGLYPYDPLPPDGNSVSLCDWDTLSCSPVDGATGYDVYFAPAPCMPLEKVAENIADPCVARPALENKHQVCYWRVTAHTPTGDIQGPTWWFAVECCFPRNFTTFNDWVAFGKPDCWCSPYHCDGDADVKDSGGVAKYCVFTGDLSLIVDNWKKKPGDPDFNPCADIDHKDSGGITKYRVFVKDLAILVANWKKKCAELPGNCPRPE
jgi:hypothetical protein